MDDRSASRGRVEKATTAAKNKAKNHDIEQTDTGAG